MIHFLLQAALLAEENPMGYLGNPFYSKNLRVEWNLATNSLPATVRLFKIVPGNFSTMTISNLMKLGGFSETNRSLTGYNGYKLPADVLCYYNGRDSLVIDSASGTVDLDAPVSYKSLPEDVPDETRSFNFATNVLRQLEFPTGQLIKDGGRLKAWFYQEETTTYPKGSEPITRRSRMKVEFRRMLDGIPSTLEDVDIDFAGQEKITSLEIRWPGIEPSKPYPVASTQKIAAWIKEGRARVQDLEGPDGVRLLQPSGIRQITIVGIKLYYTGSSYFRDKTPDEVQASRMYPYAVLKADAEINPDDHEMIWLFCPITASALSSVSTKKSPYGFGIYPSKLNDKQKPSDTTTN
jgi:hypothetical protein